MSKKKTRKPRSSLLGMDQVRKQMSLTLMNQPRLNVVNKLLTTQRGQKISRILQLRYNRACQPPALRIDTITRINSTGFYQMRKKKLAITPHKNGVY